MGLNNQNFAFCPFSWAPVADLSCYPWHPERWKSAVVQRQQGKKGLSLCVQPCTPASSLPFSFTLKLWSDSYIQACQDSNPQTSGNETQQDDHRSVGEKSKLFTYSYSFKPFDLFQFPCFYMYIMKFTNWIVNRTVQFMYHWSITNTQGSPFYHSEK